MKDVLEAAQRGYRAGKLALTSGITKRSIIDRESARFYLTMPTLVPQDTVSLSS